MLNLALSKRLQSLPPYLFAQIDQQKRALRARGVKLIDLSIGDPDIPAPQAMLSALHKYSRIKAYQKYPLDAGLDSFKAAIAGWSKKRFGISLDPSCEILPLIGSKEGLVHFPLAFVDPGDVILIPSPGYPGYRGACAFSGARVYELPLLAGNDFLPDLQKIPVSVKNKARLIYLNYPNNPTSVLAPRRFLEDAVRFCREYGIILAYDNAYSEVYFDAPASKKPLSILAIPGAKEVAIEFHSLSKTFCFTGARVGWAAGNSGLIQGLAKVKTNVDSGVFLAIQKAGETALLKENGFIEKMRRTVQERRDAFLPALKRAGFKEIRADATFYVWARLPRPWTSSLEYAAYLLGKKHIAATPGEGFGKYGEGYIRFALTLDKTILAHIVL